MTSRARTGALIFLGSLFIYQGNLRPVASLDSLPAALLPFSLYMDHSFRFDRFADHLKAGRPETPYYFREKDSHYYSMYPVALPLLVTPLYVPVLAVIHPAERSVAFLILLARVLEKCMAGLLTAMAVAVFFLALDRLTSRRNALLLTAAYGFGTTVWAISSQALWLHTGVGLFFVLTLLALAQWAGSSRMRFLYLAGLWAGLALLVRPTVGLLAVAILAALLLRRAPVRALAAFLLPVMLCGLAAAAYNVWLFQDLRGYTALPVSRHPLGGLAGILFSPARGLLIYCPILIFAAAGFGRRPRKPETPLSLLMLAGVIFCGAHLALISLVETWWGGHCWGPRYATEMMPFLVLMIVPALDTILSSAWLRPLFFALLVYSIALQSVGAFFYPAGLWDDRPVNADYHTGRFWDWVDNPVRRTVSAGPNLVGHQLLLEGLLHGKAAAIRKMKEAEFKGF
jgi:hypothetical protein